MDGANPGEGFGAEEGLGAGEGFGWGRITAPIFVLGCQDREPSPVLNFLNLGLDFQ